MKKPEKRNPKGGVAQNHQQTFDWGYNQCYDEFEKFLPSKNEIDEIVVLNTLEVAINDKANQKLVFRCCGKPIKDIEIQGSCPYCGKDTTEVIRLWKFYLAKAIAKRIGK